MVSSNARVELRCVFAAGAVANPMSSSVNGANKTVRFLKSNVFPGLRSQNGAPTDDLVFVCFSDAAWAVRHESGSQGGHLTVACRLCVLNGAGSDWESFRLPTVSQLLSKPRNM